MKKTILIAPSDGPLAQAIAAEAAAAGWIVASARAIPGAGAVPAGREAEAAKAAGPAAPLQLSYNPSSFVSISSLVLAALNALGEIDAAVMTGEGPAQRLDFAGCRPGELGAFVEARCAGPLFLARELVRRFEARRAGRIVLVAQESPRDAAPGPSASLAAGAFQGLGSGLFAAAAGAPWQAYGVLDSSGQGDKVGRLVAGLLAEPKPTRSGRWLRHTGKGGFFGAL